MENKQNSHFINSRFHATIRQLSTEEVVGGRREEEQKTERREGIHKFKLTHTDTLESWCVSPRFEEVTH